MSYIKSPEHFINYLNKILSDAEPIAQNDLLPASAYLEYIYHSEFLDEFTWEFKRDPHLLKEENLLKWLSNKRNSTPLIPKSVEHIFTHEMYEEIKALNRIVGIYSFWNEKKYPLYIGRSINMGNRIISSFSDRFKNYNRPIFLKTIKTNTATDACILEIYYISKYRPAFNQEFKYDDEITLKISGVKKFSKAIRCNREIIHNKINYTI